MEQWRDLPPRDSRSGDGREACREIAHRLISQQNAAERDGERGRSSRAGNERGCKAEDSDEQPSAGGETGEQRIGAVRFTRQSDITLDGFVFAFVPALAQFLRQAGAMPLHSFHQFVRQCEARFGPSQAAAVEAECEQDHQCDPRDQQ